MLSEDFLTSLMTELKIVLPNISFDDVDEDDDPEVFTITYARGDPDLPMNMEISTDEEDAQIERTPCSVVLHMRDTGTVIRHFSNGVVRWENGNPVRGNWKQMELTIVVVAGDTQRGKYFFEGRDIAKKITKQLESIILSYSIWMSEFAKYKVSPSYHLYRGTREAVKFLYNTPYFYVTIRLPLIYQDEYIPPVWPKRPERVESIEFEIEVN